MLVNGVGGPALFYVVHCGFMIGLFRLLNRCFPDQESETAAQAAEAAARDDDHVGEANTPEEQNIGEVDNLDHEQKAKAIIAL